MKLTTKLSVTTINLYQSYISPYKGFCCAHAALYNDVSCSEWGKHKIIEVGLLKAISEIINRLKDCKHAYSIMLSSIDDESKENNKEDSDYNPFIDKNNIYCCGNALPCYPL